MIADENLLKLYDRFKLYALSEPQNIREFARDIGVTVPTMTQFVNKKMINFKTQCMIEAYLVKKGF